MSRKNRSIVETITIGNQKLVDSQSYWAMHDLLLCQVTTTRARYLHERDRAALYCPENPSALGI